MHSGGLPPAAPGYPQPGGFAPRRPPQQPYGGGYGQQLPPQGGGQFPPRGGYGQYHRPPKKKRSVLPWLLSGFGVLLVIAVVLVLVLGFVAPGWFVRPVFDSTSVAKGVAQTLKGSYGITGVGEVTCPDGQPVEVAHRFDCQVSINSQPRTVTVTVKNDRGVYEVGHPK
ncbi:DUF4333 domain-containing protein [Saccharopolyspora sp. K220]|uniref:DUF4333 domain-containing protein n=1 Tax=Saccharopolyspora soli TaxID=2926618 RepID=UPI001F56BFC6|nr:DUF4333 domain-containing protein [Saccharopolyspora soli]MCI2423052.1 DUF4333 domain-containing protein [Saccharopolyspora soli]